jgi:hypothetical protein
MNKNFVRQVGDQTRLYYAEWSTSHQDLYFTFKLGVFRCKRVCFGDSYLWTTSTLQNMLRFRFAVNENGNVLAGSVRCYLLLLWLVPTG